MNVFRENALDQGATKVRIMYLGGFPTLCEARGLVFKIGYPGSILQCETKSFVELNEIDIDNAEIQKDLEWLDLARSVYLEAGLWDRIKGIGSRVANALAGTSALGAGAVAGAKQFGQTIRDKAAQIGHGIANSDTVNAAKQAFYNKNIENQILGFIKDHSQKFATDVASKIKGGQFANLENNKTQEYQLKLPNGDVVKIQIQMAATIHPDDAEKIGAKPATLDIKRSAASSAEPAPKKMEPIQGL